MKKFGFFSCIILIFLCSFGCKKSLRPSEGFVKVEGGKIWYKIVGEGKGIPLLIIHGGPGSRSCGSIQGYSRLADQRPVIVYDQLGSGKSDRPTDTVLWKIDRFVEEVSALKKQLDINELHILGHSWGGTVLVEYMVTKKPEGIRSVIFTGPLLSTPVWIRDAKILLSQLPQNIQDTIQKYEKLKDYTAPSYLAATDSFYARFLSVKQWPRTPSEDCEGVPGSNDQVYNYMWGPTEFTATGTLIDFDRTDRLHEIRQPILFIGGRHDEARPETLYEFQKLVPHAQVKIIEDAGHAILYDQPLAYTEAIRKFLIGAENNGQFPKN